METYYLAVDIGASSGRHMLAHMENGKIHLEEIYRFKNGQEEKNGHLCWDIERLREEIINGLKICKDIGKIPVSMGIDTWAVDFVLLDKDGNLLGDAVGYRDSRTKGMDEKVSEIISLEGLYKRTGIQKQIFNTVYQLMAVKSQMPELMEKAECMLLIPDYLGFCLTGVKGTEYTNATTTQLISPKTKDWDYELIQELGYKKSLFQPITQAGNILGRLSDGIERQVGFNLDVVQVASHDTASAVLAVPAKEKDFLYISSGTWSLMGVEQKEADCSEESRKANLTNEGGYEYRYRFLKNIMGLWMVQSVRHEWDDKYSFGELRDMALEYSSFPSRVDVNDVSFLAPDSMVQAVKDYCGRTGQPVPEEAGEVANVIYQSLADSYSQTAKELEKLTGKIYTSINIVGGGSHEEVLSQLTANKTKKTVYAGPTEATAIGNIIVQMLRKNEFGSVEEARAAVFESFPIKSYYPQTKQ